MMAPDHSVSRPSPGVSPCLEWLGERLETPTRILIVPGGRNSEPAHWQSLWADRLPNARRVEQGDWLFPRRRDWVERLADAILASRGEHVVIVAHSLGCIVTAHLPPAAAACIGAALLVAPADPERRAKLADFAPVPHQRLPYRSTLVASSKDPNCPVRLAGAYARAWGSAFVRLPAPGHINAETGHFEWPQGMALLQSLLPTAPHTPMPLAHAKYWLTPQEF